MAAKKDNGLYFGDWVERLTGVECDTLIVDPPYGDRCHSGHDAGVSGAREAYEGAGRSRSYGNARRRELSYGRWTPDDVRHFVAEWEPRTRGWFCAMSCSDLFPYWRECLEAQGRCTFAPIPCVIRGMSVRLAGDGPSSWAVYLNVARPRAKKFSTWGTLPGAYVVTRKGGDQHIGGKPLELMRAIVRDYSRKGDLVCDPCAGFATTGIAALGLGRKFVGAEIEKKTFERGFERLGSYQMDLWK